MDFHADRRHDGYKGSGPVAVSMDNSDAISIPEGDVLKIDDGTNDLWYKPQKMTFDLFPYAVDGFGWWNTAWTRCSGYGSDTSWIWSTLIPVGAGKIVYKLYLFNGAGHITAWDKSGIQTGYLTGSASGQVEEGEWQIPQGTKFIRVCFLNPNSTTGQRYNQSATFVGYSPLPRRYRLLDYIESTGTQYIDSGVVPSAAMVQDCHFTATQPSTDQKFYGMAGTGGVFLGTLSGKFRLGASLTLSSILVSSNRSRSLSLDRDWLIEGESATAGAVSNPTYTMYIFAARHKTYGTLFGKVKIHKLLLSTALNASSYGFAAGTPIACFLPCIDLYDGSIGIFDTVANTFKGNLGTGTFVAGPEL